MARIEKFEDIEARKRGRVLRKPIHERTKAGAFARDFALRGPTELEFKTLQSLAIEISRPTAGLIKYLKDLEMRGAEFRLLTLSVEPLNL